MIMKAFVPLLLTGYFVAVALSDSVEDQLARASVQLCERLKSQNSKSKHRA